MPVRIKIQAKQEVMQVLLPKQKGNFQKKRKNWYSGLPTI